MIALLLGCHTDLGPRSAAHHAEDCGECHTVASEQFEGSAHARPRESELFEALRDRAGEDATCDSCHLETFDCLTCHAAAGAVEIANGTLIHDPTGPVRGPWGDTDGPHASDVGMLTSGALCGTCHDNTSPGAFDEHPYATGLAFGVPRCQDCHMSPEPGLDVPRVQGPIATDGISRARSDHAFIGLRTDPTTLLGNAVVLSGTETGVRLEHRAGHAFPDGASFTRELWLQTSTERIELHPMLQLDGRSTSDPLTADARIERSLLPGETLEIPTDEACLWFRPVHQELALALGLTVPEPIQVACATARTPPAL